jgi:hypothetical protein
MLKGIHTIEVLAVPIKGRRKTFLVDFDKLMDMLLNNLLRTHNPKSLSNSEELPQEFHSEYVRVTFDTAIYLKDTEQ